ncbi:MAG: penicillin-binding transpeptidase domain-containing protein, partial [Bacteroidota bacterium]
MSDRYRKGKKAGLSHKEIRAQFDEETPMTLFSWDGDMDTVMTPYDSLKYYSRFLETGMVSIDPRTAHIKAWVGGIDFRYFKYDHVGLGKRQVGSTFKPFVYAAAIDNGSKPCDQELNQPVVFENTDGEGTRWAPKNASGKFGGLMTLRRALATSTNLITARLMKQLGPPVVVDYARAAGIKSHLDAVYSLCLGTTDLTVLELTGAYSTFANHGKQQTPIFITRIEDAKGNVLQEFSPVGREAFNERTAYMMLDLLKGVVDEPGGTASRLRHDYHFRNEIGAKTGTTQNHADGWFMGVTNNLVSGVWVGCADRRMRFRDIKLGQGANMALPIWALYMKKVYGDAELEWEAENFTRPRNLRYSMACDTDLDAIMRKNQDSPSAQSSEEDDLDSFQ